MSVPIIGAGYVDGLPTSVSRGPRWWLGLLVYWLSLYLIREGSYKGASISAKGSVPGVIEIDHSVDGDSAGTRCVVGGVYPWPSSPGALIVRSERM